MDDQVEALLVRKVEVLRRMHERLVRLLPNYVAPQEVDDFEVRLVDAEIEYARFQAGR